MKWSHEEKVSFFSICMFMITICSLGLFGSIYFEPLSLIHSILQTFMTITLILFLVAYLGLMLSVYVWNEYIA